MEDVEKIKIQAKIDSLYKKLEKTRASNRSMWDSYGSELCAGEMIKEEEKIEKEIERLQANYMQVIENSHFWTDLNMLLQFLDNAEIMDMDKKALIDYLKIGLKNTKKEGYELAKLTDI